MRFITLVNGCLQLLGITGLDVAYDNTSSGLSATNSQAAIDELALNGGGSSNCINLDGGASDSNYGPDLCIDGGNSGS